MLLMKNNFIATIKAMFTSLVKKPEDTYTDLEWQAHLRRIGYPKPKEAWPPKRGESGEPDHVDAHRFCINNKRALMENTLCGCFYCMRIFKPESITEWTRDWHDFTALCPHCGIDSVIGENSGYPIVV